MSFIPLTAKIRSGFTDVRSLSMLTTLVSLIRKELRQFCRLEGLFWLGHYALHRAIKPFWRDQSAARYIAELIDENHARYSHRAVSTLSHHQ